MCLFKVVKSEIWQPDLHSQAIPDPNNMQRALAFTLFGLSCHEHFVKAMLPKTVEVGGNRVSRPAGVSTLIQSIDRVYGLYHRVWDRHRTRISRGLEGSV